MAQVTAYYNFPDGPSPYCSKHVLFAIDWAEAQRRPDALRWGTGAQSGTVIDRSTGSNVKSVGTGTGLPGRTYGGDH